MHGWRTYMLSEAALSTIARLAYVQVCRVRRDVRCQPSDHPVCLASHVNRE